MNRNWHCVGRAAVLILPMGLSFWDWFSPCFRTVKSMLRHSWTAMTRRTAQNNQSANVMGSLRAYMTPKGETVDMSKKPCISKSNHQYDGLVVNWPFHDFDSACRPLCCSSSMPVLIKCSSKRSIPLETSEGTV